MNAIKPDARKANWAKQTAGDKNKDLKQVMKEQDTKDKKLQKAKEQGKQKYTVQNNFTPKPKGKAKTKPGQATKPKMFKNAEDEVNQYMKDLGLV